MVGGVAIAAYFEVRRVTIAAVREHLQQVSLQLDAALRSGVAQRLDEVSQLAAAPENAAYLRAGSTTARRVPVSISRVTGRDSLNAAVELWSAAGQRLLLVGRPLPPVASNAPAGAVGPLRVVDSAVLFPSSRRYVLVASRSGR